MTRLLLAVAMAVSSGFAAPIYSNGLPNGAGGANFNDFRAAEDFVLSQDAIIGILRFWTFAQPQEPADIPPATATIDDVSWAIYEDSGGAPGAALQSGSVSFLTGSDAGQDLGLREIAVNFPLAAGNYFIEFHTAATLNSAGPVGFAWATAGPNATTLYRFSDDLNTTPSTPINSAIGEDLTHLAFELDGVSVPEPLTVLTAGLGLAALLLRRR